MLPETKTITWSHRSSIRTWDQSLVSSYLKLKRKLIYKTTSDKILSIALRPPGYDTINAILFYFNWNRKKFTISINFFIKIQTFRCFILFWCCCIWKPYIHLILFKYVRLPTSGAPNNPHMKKDTVYIIMFFVSILNCVQFNYLYIIPSHLIAHQYFFYIIK